ncbi:MAG TPA: response regulator [Xanthobacteraceae bacterium]|nr:response regulator [Xanthobacteraceae bacterium]
MDLLLPVLLVDDFRTMTTVMTKLVHDIGYQDVDQAQDGASALELIGKKKYDLVLCDKEMRPMNGPELVQNIRKSPLNADTIIIMVTAMASSDTSWASAADGCLVKPFKVEDLKAKIAEAYARRSKPDMPLAS